MKFKFGKLKSGMVITVAGNKATPNVKLLVSHIALGAHYPIKCTIIKAEDCSAINTLRYQDPDNSSRVVTLVEDGRYYNEAEATDNDLAIPLNKFFKPIKVQRWVRADLLERVDKCHTNETPFRLKIDNKWVYSTVNADGVTQDRPANAPVKAELFYRVA